MGQLTNQFVSQSYQGLLNLANANTGLTTNLQTVTDGLGGSSPLQISQTQVNISGAFTVNGAPVSVDTGSLVTKTEFNSYTSSVDLRFDGIELETGSLQNQINQKLDTGSFNSYTSSVNTKLAGLDIETGSLQNQINGLATTGSLSGYTTVTTFNNYTSSNDSKVNSLISQTGSYVTETESGSFVTNVAQIPFVNDGFNVVKGNGSSTFITINNVQSSSYSQNSTSASFAQTALSASYAPDISNRNGLITTGSIGGSQSITGSLNVEGTISATSASFTYVNTVYETASVIYSTGSNQFGDDALDVQTLNGVVNVPLATLNAGNGLNVTGTTTFYDTVKLSNGPLDITGSVTIYDTPTSSLILGQGSGAVGLENSGNGFNVITDQQRLSVNYSGVEITGSLKVTGQIRTEDTLVAINGIQTNNITNPGTAGDIVIDSGLFKVSINGNTEVTGTLKVTDGITGSLFGTASYATNALSSSHAINADTASFASNIDKTGLITTGSIAGTQSITGSLISSGSLTVTGSVILSGSVGPELNVIGDQLNTGSLTLRSGSLNLYSNNTLPSVSPELFVTNSFVGQSNTILGWGDNNNLIGGAGATQANYTSSLRITGSNNIVSMPLIRATAIGGSVDQQGYISGSGNIIINNASGIYLNTGSLLSPKTQNNILGVNSSILMNYTTSSLAGGHPIVGNNLILGGQLFLNSPSGSANASTNAILGGQITSNQTFVTNTRPTISSNNVIGLVTLNHISSSINYGANYNNSPVTVNNHLSSSNITNNFINVNSNAFLGGSQNQGHNIYVSGSQNSNNFRQIADNLIGGRNNVVSSSFVSSSNASLLSTIIYGNGLTVSGSVTQGLSGGSAFFGRFNDTGSGLNLSQDIVFAVGTGPSAGSRRTGFWIDSGSVTNISSSLNIKGVTNALVVTGSSNITHNIAGQNALTIVNTAGTGQPALFVSGTLNVTGSGDHSVAGNTIQLTGSTLMYGNGEFPLTVYGTINSKRLHFNTNPFNTNPSSNLGAIRMGADNQTFQYTNYNMAEITTQSFIDQYVNTGSLTTQTRFGATYGGTTARVDVVNNNGTRLVNIITDDMNITGSLAVTGDIKFASGSNKTMGTFVLDGGNPSTATISNSLVTANSLIFLTKQTNTNSGNGTVSVTSKGTGTFSVTSNHNGDTDTVAYLIINPS